MCGCGALQIQFAIEILFLTSVESQRVIAVPCSDACATGSELRAGSRQKRQFDGLTPQQLTGWKVK